MKEITRDHEKREDESSVQVPSINGEKVALAIAVEPRGRVILEHVMACLTVWTIKM